MAHSFAFPKMAERTLKSKQNNILRFTYTNSLRFGSYAYVSFSIQGDFNL